MSKLLPPGSTPLMRAVAEACAPRVDPLPLTTLWNPQTCPAALLPWLAWSLSVDEWDSQWPVDIQRQVIASSIQLHREKGTLAAVRRTLRSVGVVADVQDWRDYDGVPYSFAVQAWVNNNYRDDGCVLSPEIYQRLSRLIDLVKPARSPYALRIGARFESTPIKLANAQHTAAIGRWSSTAQPVQPTPAQQPLRLANTQHARAVARASATPTAVQPAAAINPVRLANAARPMTIIRVTMEAQ